MSLSIPDASHRWRCGGCGNLTRFDVVRTRRTAEYWHVDLAGSPEVEETTVDREVLESVTCRWCGRADAIEYADRAEVDVAADPTGETDEDAVGIRGAEPVGDPRR